MQDITSKTIREIALEMPLSTRVFEEYKIDYCCGGRVPFNEACRNAGVDPLTMLLKIESATQSGDGDPADAVSRKSMSDLVDHIIGSHHVFTRNELDRLSPLMDKVCRKHGDLHPELFEIQELFKQLVHGLPPHMSKEEMVLFPYIKQLDVATRSGEPLDIPHFGTVQNPIRMMMFEHDTDGETLAECAAFLLTTGRRKVLAQVSIRCTPASRIWKKICTGTFTWKITSCSRRLSTWKKRSNQNYRAQTRDPVRAASEESRYYFEELQASGNKAVSIFRAALSMLLKLAYYSIATRFRHVGSGSADRALITSLYGFTSAFSTRFIYSRA